MLCRSIASQRFEPIAWWDATSSSTSAGPTWRSFRNETRWILGWLRFDASEAQTRQRFDTGFQCSARSWPWAQVVGAAVSAVSDTVSPCQRGLACRINVVAVAQLCGAGGAAVAELLPRPCALNAALLAWRSSLKRFFSAGCT